METRLNPAHVHIVLVRPQSPGNIGAVARAMRNMGLQHLVLVAPERFPHPEARMMARGAEELLEQARVYATLPEAVASCHWLLGTSARPRQYRKPLLNPRQMSAKLLTLTQDYQVGVLFGPEDSGLTTAELDGCHDLVVIPTVSTATSLNLAQAVMVLCYEMMQAHTDVPPAPAPPLVSVADSEAMYDHLRQAFAVHGFPGESTIERALMGLRRLFERTGLEQRDVRLLRGIARQLGWALRHPRRPEPRD
jgi:TrmH family RNA methyltransferase